MAAAERFATFPASSAATATRVRVASCASRRIAGGETTWLAMNRSAMPPSAIASAMLTLAQVTPSAPAAICIRAIAGARWVLTCGRSWAGLSAKKAAMRAILASNQSRSTKAAGVISSETGRPIAGWSISTSEYDTVEPLRELLRGTWPGRSPVGLPLRMIPSNSTGVPLCLTT